MTTPRCDTDARDDDAGFRNDWLMWLVVGLLLGWLVGCENPISPERLSNALGCEVTEVRNGCWHVCPVEGGGVAAQRVC